MRATRADSAHPIATDVRLCALRGPCALPAGEGEAAAGHAVPANRAPTDGRPAPSAPGSIVSAWHERSLKQPPGAATGVKDCIAHQAGHAQHAAEAGAAAQRGAEREAEGAAEAALLCARRARLAQLLERERLGFEAELEARGMALDLVHFRQ